MKEETKEIARIQQEERAINGRASSFIAPEEETRERRKAPPSGTETSERRSKRTRESESERRRLRLSGLKCSRRRQKPVESRRLFLRILLSFH